MRGRSPVRQSKKIYMRISESKMLQKNYNFHLTLDKENIIFMILTLPLWQQHLVGATIFLLFYNHIIYYAFVSCVRQKLNSLYKTGTHHVFSFPRQFSESKLFISIQHYKFSRICFYKIARNHNHCDLDMISLKE